MRVNQRTLPWLPFTIEQSLYTLLLQKTIEGLNCNTWVPFSTHLKKSRAHEDWIGWWSNCWLFGAWFLQSGTTSAFWWLERLDSISWVNNQIYSTGLCVLLNYKCKEVREWFFFSVESTTTIQNIPFSLITYIGYKRHINLRH